MQLFKGRALSNHLLSFLKSKKRHRINQFPKIMVQFCYLRLYLGTKTVFLSFVATDGKDGHRWKREKVKPTLLAFKHHQQIITVIAP